MTSRHIRNSCGSCRLAMILFQVSLALTLCVGSAARADVPTDINLQGVLLDNAGDPLPGSSVNLTIRIYDALFGGALLYQEDHQSASLRNGLFNVLLGTGSSRVNNLDADTFECANCYLELLVDGDLLAPRQPFSSVAYALQSARSLSLDASAAAAFAQSDHDHDGDYSPDGHGHAELAASSHDHAGVYPPVSHTHSAADITSGSLSTNRYDAYVDLSQDGSLDNNADTDLLIRSQLDGRYSDSAHGHSISLVVNERTATFPCASSSNCTQVVNCDAGELLTGGGFKLNEGGVGLLGIFESKPDIGNNRWMVTTRNTSGVEIDYVIFAMCARLSG
jgi:hypothetical protein